MEWIQNFHRIWIRPDIQLSGLETRYTEELDTQYPAGYPTIFFYIQFIIIISVRLGPDIRFFRITSSKSGPDIQKCQFPFPDFRDITMLFVTSNFLTVWYFYIKEPNYSWPWGNLEIQLWILMEWLEIEVWVQPRSRRRAAPRGCLDNLRQQRMYLVSLFVSFVSISRNKTESISYFVAIFE